MSYLVLARKYRPRRFSDVIGQVPVVRTLTNALEADTVAQAYLFTGPRGVGKTTLARILSMALNCQSQKRKGADPCGECGPCRRIAQGTDFDIHEIDGASHGRIEEARVVIENVQSLPAQGRYRIYIIDEVHMLSAPAFNALLKTLEEPPPHVKFIFATTQVSKVLATILSRCQRFDLRRIDLALIARHLAGICKEEKIDAEPEVLAAIAHRADGCLRDALTLLDQARAYAAGTKLTMAGVSEVLGMADAGAVERLLAAAVRGEAAGVLGEIDALWAAGQDLETVAGQLLEASREKLPGAAGRESRSLLMISGALFRVWGQIRSSRAGKAALEWALLQGGSAEEEVRRQETPPPAAASGPPVSPVAKVLAGAPDPRRAEDPPPEKGTLASRDLGERWPEFMQRLKQQRKTTGAFLADARPGAVEANAFEILFPADQSFHRDSVEQETHRATIEQCFRNLFGVSLRMKTKLSDKPQGAPTDAASASAAAVLSPPVEATLAQADPLVRRAAELFQGHVVPDRKEAHR